VIGVGNRDAVGRGEAVRGRLAELEAAIGTLPDLTSEARAELARRVTSLHACLEEERHQMGHDLRAPLNAIAGWAHILRLDSTTAGTVLRAADVFDRNVRALTQLIDTYTRDSTTSEGGR